MIESESRGHPSVRLDAEHGTDAAVRHLLELGHPRIGHVASVYDLPTFRLRRRAVDRLVEARVPRVRSDFTLDSARAAALELLTRHPELTALFCDDDVIAAGAYLAARELGLGIPGDALGRRLRRARHRPRARSAAHDGRRRRRAARARRRSSCCMAQLAGKRPAQPRAGGRARRARLDRRASTRHQAAVV